VCRKCAVWFDPLYAHSSFFATLEFCFRAGLVVRKCLISKADRKLRTCSRPHYS
jgi:hypothetical protein